ncbi:MAG: hypothetical protein LBL07_12685 [Tannerella sp.]|nr:hypothetical protein [Tannerella sp.]
MNRIDVGAWFNAADIYWILMRFFRAYFSGRFSGHTKFEAILSSVKHKNSRTMKKNIFQPDSS